MSYRADPRLQTMTEAARAMESGRFDVEVPTEPPDEVGRLGAAIGGLGQALEEKYAQLSALQSVTEQLDAGVLLEQVCDKVYTAFSDVIPYERLGLALIDDAGEHVTARWARHDAADPRIAPGFTAPLLGSSLATVLETGQPRILNDLVQYLAEHPESRSTRLIVEEGVRSSLTCPLINQGRPVGFLFFSSHEPRTYEDAHVEMFQQIASHLAAVIEKSRLHARLLEVNSVKNRFLGMAAHDMRSPLTVILGWVDMLRGGHVGDLPAPADPILGYIETSAEQVLALVEDLLDVSVIEEGRLDLSRELLDLGPHLASRQESRALLLAAKGTRLALERPPGPAIVLADPRRLDQAIDNLVGNASKYAPAGTVVTVRVVPCEIGWGIAVEDQGPGIPLEEQAEIFGAFEQASTRPTAGERSIGLGLAISRRVVEAHGGSIRLDSEVGRGSTFTIELPSGG